MKQILYNVALNRIIAKIENYLRTDLRYIIKGGFWLAMVKAISSGASFVSSIAFANFLPTEVYGSYRLILSYFGLLSIPTLNGMDNAVIKSIGQGYDGSLLPAFKAKVRWGLLAGLGSFIVALYYFWQGDNQLAWPFLIATFFLPLMDPANLFAAYLNGRKDFVTYTKYNSTIRLIATAWLIVTIILTKNIVLLILSYLVVYTLLRLIFMIIVLRQIKVDAPVDQTAIPYGKHLSLMGVLATISLFLDKALVFHFIGATALAGYYLAMIPLRQVQDLLGNFNTLAMPKFASSDKETLRLTLPQKVLRAYLFVIPIIIIYAIMAPIVFKLFYPKYLEVVGISIIFMTQLLFYPLGIFGTALIAQGEKNKLYVIYTNYAVIRIVLLLVLVPWLGITGAVIAITTTAAINAGLTTYLFLKEVRA